MTGDAAPEPLAARLGALDRLAGSAPQRAALLIALGWGGALGLAALEGAAWGPVEAHPYLRDLGAFSRFALAVGVLATMDARVDAQLRAHLRRLRAAGDNPDDYVETTLKVSERRYGAWPEPIRAGFEPARTVTVGAPKFAIAPRETA